MMRTDVVMLIMFGLKDRGSSTLGRAFSRTFFGQIISSFEEGRFLTLFDPPFSFNLCVDYNNCNCNRCAQMLS